MLGINLSLDLEPGLISVLFINTQVKLVRFIIKVTFAIYKAISSTEGTVIQLLE